MNFHLSFPIEPFAQKLNYANKSLFVGSCFAENIGEELEKLKFDVSINPFGILYNPISISHSIQRIVENKPVDESELFYKNECWNSWEHHSRFSNPDKENCLREINKSIEAAHHYLKQADWLFVTLGSSFIYTYKSLEKVVGNCHKVPQKEFNKSLLRSADTANELSNLCKNLQKFNPKLAIIFTVSPVRYIRDGIVENNVSKSRLIDAVHTLVKENKNTFYFPAYELVIDDLRDYRFFKSDMVHPNTQAIEYVYTKFKETLFDSPTTLLSEKIREILQAKQHKPFNEKSSSHFKFKEAYFKKCQQLKKEYSFLELSEEIRFFEK